MSDKDIELKLALDKIDFTKYIDYGKLLLQIRNGKVCLVTLERTIKMD